MQSTRTIYGAHLSTCKMLGAEFEPPQYSTLNEKFTVAESEAPPAGYPDIRYIAIGNKGVSYEVTGGNLLTQPLPHLPNHAALYGHIPFVAVKVANDLDANEKKKYRIRKLQQGHDGEMYACYYLKVFDTPYLGTNIDTAIELRNVNNSNITTSAYTPLPSALEPVAPNISNFDLNDPSGDYLVSTGKIKVELTTDDIVNIIEACTNLYGDPRYATISEVGVVSGIDKLVVPPGGGAQYTEALQAQIVSFVYQFHALTSSSSTITLNLDIGSAEPLLI